MIYLAKMTAALLIVICILVALDRKTIHRDSLGEAEACEGGEYFKGTQAQILAYGLQDARGITVDPTGRYIYIAERDRPMLVYDTRNELLDVQARMGGSACPDGLCGDMDARDVALSRNNIFVAAHGNGTVLRRVDSCDADAFSPAAMEALYSAHSPTGIRIGSRAIYVTDDSPVKDDCKDCTKKIGGSLYVIPITHDDNERQAATVAPLKSKQQSSPSSRSPRGATVDSEGQHTAPQPVRISEALHRPSGVLPDEANARVYVADADDEDKVLRWVIFKKEEDEWRPAGYLSSTPTGSKALPKFLGLASGNGMIFAAGPMALYAFKPDGTSMGKMVFDEPVSGVTVAGNAIYLIVGNVLGRIQIPHQD